MKSTTIWKMLLTLCKSIIYIFFENRCLHCNVKISASDALCCECWNTLEFILHTPAIHGHFAFAQVISIFRYSGVIANLIKRFKDTGDTKLKHFFSHLMYFRAKRLLCTANYIIPVPMHKKKLRLRKYNQSSILARSLAAKVKKVVLVDGLAKIRDSVNQRRLSGYERRVNLYNAFTVPEKHKTTLCGANVLLVDDVLTTGTTANECAKALLKAGSKSVSVLTIATV